MVPLRWLAIACCVWGAACGSDRSRVAELAEAVAPHVDAFARFEVWAHRAQDAVRMGEDGGREALTEATFAPIRHEQGVLFAVVEHEARKVRRISFPDGTVLPSKLTLAPVHVPGLARVEAGFQKPCAVELPTWWRDGAGAGACVVLSRRSEREGAEALRVTVGYLPQAKAAAPAQLRGDVVR